MKKIWEILKRHKKETVIGYIVLCLVYMVVQLVRPRSEQYMALYSVKGIIMYTIIFLFAGVAMYSVVFAEEKQEKKVKSNSNKKITEMIGSLWKKYYNLIGIVLVFVSMTYAALYVYRTDIRTSMNSTRDGVITSVGTGKIEVTEEVKEISQEFTTTEEELIGVSPAFYMENPLSSRTGKIEAVVLRNGQEEIAKTSVDISEISNGFSWKIMFNQEELQADQQKYTLILKFPEDISEYKISLAITNEEGKVKAKINEVEGNDTLAIKSQLELNHFLRPYFLVICGVLAVFAVLLYYLLFIRKIGLEWCAFFSILVVGSIYGFLVTPYMVPDEETHIDMAYRYADILMNTGNTDDFHCLKREEDAQKLFISDPSIENYRYVYENIGKTATNEEIIEANATANSGAYLFMHFPGAVGIVLARVFHLGYVQMLFLGRFMGLFVFAFAVFLGMKKLPFGKATLFVLSILPITLQQANSFSYDSILFSAALLYICYIFSMAYSQEKLKALDIAVCCALGIAIIYCKSGAYTPIVFLFLLIPIQKFVSKKAGYICMGSFSIVFLLGFLVKNIKVVNTAAETTNKVMGIQEAITMPNYSLSYILQNPMVLLDVLNNTFADKSEFYLQSMLGQHLGWIQVELSNVIVMAFIIILLFSAFRARGEKQYVTTGNKWMIFLLCAASAMLVLMGMLVSWTPITYVSVEGVQGRYFFPLLFPMLMMIRNSKIIFDKNEDRAIMFSGCMTTIAAAICFIHVVL